MQPSATSGASSLQIHAKAKHRRVIRCRQRYVDLLFQECEKLWYNNAAEKYQKFKRV